MSLVRVILGAVFAALTAMFLALFAWGLWNPGRYVVLLTHFGNPFTGTFVVLGCATLAVWLLFPVRSEASQSRRNSTRWALLVLALVSSLPFLWVAETSLFTYNGRVVDRPAGGRFALAVVDRGTYGREVRVWTGHGVTTRDLGSFGKVCGSQVEARFTGEGQVFVSTVYGDFHLRLDEQGRPVTFIGSTCSG